LEVLLKCEVDVKGGDEDAGIFVGWLIISVD